jgi:hypothetical protein
MLMTGPGLGVGELGGRPGRRAEMGAKSTSEFRE